MVRAMCGAKLNDKKNTDKFMNMLGLRDSKIWKKQLGYNVTVML